MHNDERPAGRAWSRRDLVKLCDLSAGARQARAVPSPPSADAVPALQDCIAQPEQTEVPYFVDERLQRADIRLDPRSGRVSAGLPLELWFVVSRVTDQGSCVILPGAQVPVRDMIFRDGGTRLILPVAELGDDRCTATCCLAMRPGEPRMERRRLE